jgi:hypothetical protein
VNKKEKQKMLNVTAKTTDKEIQKAGADIAKIQAKNHGLYLEFLVLQRHIAKKFETFRRQGLALHAEITKLERKVKQSKET